MLRDHLQLLLVQILNHHREAGVALNDKKHPIKALEKWAKTGKARAIGQFYLFGHQRWIAAKAAYGPNLVMVVVVVE